MLDYTIAGADVDCKFSHRLGGWMIPPKADGKLLLVVRASDEDGTWSAGLLRASPENLSPAGDRDGKRSLKRPRPRRGALAARPRPAVFPQHGHPHHSSMDSPADRSSEHRLPISVCASYPKKHC